MSKQYLNEIVNITRQFQRSIHIDADFGKLEALQGYICQGSAKSVLENITRQILETNQRAFTWTGPYGGGKSSLALGLCSLVHSDNQVRAQAIKALNLHPDSSTVKIFDATVKNWIVMPIVGRRSSVVQDIYYAYLKAKNIKVESICQISSKELLKLLAEESKSNAYGGILIVIDELGKFLESAVQNNDDIYFYQQLAELANRLSGHMVVIGVLHQAFEQYGAKLGKETRDEWSKIQGRYVDIPLVSVSDELVELTGKAIQTNFEHPKSADVSKKIAELIRLRRPSIGERFWSSLDDCWPLHPVSAALLAPISRRRFGQNERSTFGFLVSVEPKGFKEFLITTSIDQTNYYLPSALWDYLKVNLEPAILASPDGHRWAQAAEAVDRSELKGSAIHVQLAKTIAVIELFKNGSGLLTDKETLVECLPTIAAEKIDALLVDLKSWSIITYRKHLSAWGVFAGSDFDIDGALQDALIYIGDPDLNQLEKLTDLYPVVAKRHYFSTGTLRWMNVGLCHASQMREIVENFTPANDSFGAFILSIPNRETQSSKIPVDCKHASKQKSNFPIVLGAPKNGEAIRELSRELLGLEYVRRNRPEHEGDPIARREIDGRISTVKNQLENSLREAFIGAQWFLNEKEVINPGVQGLSFLASNLADELFHQTPHIFSELLNKAKLSSTTATARRKLLHGMVLNENSENSGFEGYPVEAGLYHVTLKSTGMHEKTEEGFRFKKPSTQGRGASFLKAWEAAEIFIESANKNIKLSELFSIWSAPPFGIKNGVLPVLGFAFILANKDRMAVYKNGMFIPELNDSVIDEALQDLSKIAIRYVRIDKERELILEGISEQLKLKLSSGGPINSLEAARALVSVIFRLPAWVQRTNTISAKARQVRDLLLRASDPHKVLFVDLPVIFETENSLSYIKLLGDILEEINTAYDNMLQNVMSKLMSALDADINDVDNLKARANLVSGISGDFRLDGFSARLSLYEKNRNFYEGLLGLAVNKPSRDWNDQDVDLALITLADWALKFRQTEVLAFIQNRNPSRKAIAIVFGTGDAGETVSKTFDISIKDQIIVDKLAEIFIREAKDLTPDIFLAALAQAGVNTLNNGDV